MIIRRIENRCWQNEGKIVAVRKRGRKIRICFTTIERTVQKPASFPYFPARRRSSKF